MEVEAARSSEVSTRATKSGMVFISRHGPVVTMLRHDAAREFLADAERACAREQQDLVARHAGDTKQGNERLAETEPRRR